MRRLCLFALLIALAPLAHAQSPSVSALVERGEAAFREGRIVEAIRLLKQATDSPQADAEAFYRLGIALRADSPEQDLGAARKAVERAASLAPDNPEYLTAELESLRGESGNFFLELLRARERRQIAERLLGLDSTNAFAHEELATIHIAEYYRYRNAIWTSGAGFDPIEFTTSDEEDRLTEKPELDEEDAGGLGTNVYLDPGLDPQGAIDGANLSTREVAAGDFAATRGNQFDSGLIRGLGSGSFAERADRAYDLALGHLLASLANDPRRRSLYDHVMRLAALSDDWTLAGAPLAEMFVHFPDDPQMWLYLGLMNHRVGEWEAAAASFANALQRMSDEERAVFEDLTYVLAPDQEKEYRASPEVYAARFWSSRDPRFLNPFNERRLEHYARLTTADLLYRSNDLDLPGWKTERGQIHVRYGVPQEDIILEGDIGVVLERYLERNEAFNAPEMFGLANRFNIWDYGDQQFVFEDPNRNGEFTLYSPPADLFGLTSVRGIESMDYVLRARSAFRTDPERYDFKVPGREVYIPALVSAFRTDGPDAEVYVHYGVPLAPEAAGRDGTIPATIKTGAFLVGEDNVLLAERRKTMFGLRTDQVVPYKDVRLWVASETVSARPGDYEVSVEFETANGMVAGVHRQPVEVPDFSGTDLMLSSLLLAVQVEEGATAGPGRIQRGDFAIQPAPWGVYAVSDPIAVYFEVYGLGLDGGQTGYDVEARLIPKDRSRGLARLAKRLFGGRARGVSTSFPAQGTSEDARQYVLLDATGQEPGVYTLTLRIEDRVTGQRAEREVDLLLE